MASFINASIGFSEHRAARRSDTKRARTGIRWGEIALALLIGLSNTVHAQERVMNDDSRGTLHTWPQSGNWIVSLVRGEDGLLCTMITGHRDTERDDLYVWGMRHTGQVWSMVVADRNSEALAGDSIGIVVDGSRVGRYSITKRAHKSGMYVVRADLPYAESSRVIRLMALGGSLKFVTEGSTYSVQLDGIAHALVYMSACDTEAESLRGP